MGVRPTTVHSGHLDLHGYYNVACTILSIIYTQALEFDFLCYSSCVLYSSVAFIHVFSVTVIQCDSNSCKTKMVVWGIL